MHYQAFQEIDKRVFETTDDANKEKRTKKSKMLAGNDVTAEDKEAAKKEKATAEAHASNRVSRVVCDYRLFIRRSSCCYCHCCLRALADDVRVTLRLIQKPLIANMADTTYCGPSL